MKRVINVFLLNIIVIWACTALLAQTREKDKATIEKNRTINAVMKKYALNKDAGINKADALKNAVADIPDRTEVLFTIGKIFANGARDLGEEYEHDTKTGQDSAIGAIKKGFEEAKVIFLEGLNNKPANGAQLCLAVSILYESTALNNNDSAVFYLRKGYQEYPNSIAADSCAYNANDFDLIVNNYKTSPLYRDSYFRLASIFFHAEPTKTIKMYSEYIDSYVDKINPKYEDKLLWLNRGDYFMKLGKYTEAENDFTYYIKLTPKDNLDKYRTYIKLTKLYDKINDSEKEKQSFIEAASIFNRYITKKKGLINMMDELKAPLKEFQAKYPDVEIITE